MSVTAIPWGEESARHRRRMANRLRICAISAARLLIKIDVRIVGSSRAMWRMPFGLAKRPPRFDRDCGEEGLQVDNSRLAACS